MASRNSGEIVGSPPENCTDIWRRGLMLTASSSSFSTSRHRQLVDVADLVGVHEARIAHHVAAVRQIDGQHRAASVSLMDDVPWLCSVSVTAGKSRPGKSDSRRRRNAGLIASVSTKLP